MPVTMHARLMPMPANLFHQIGMLFDGLSNQEERGQDRVARQRLEHLRCVAWMRAIVKSEGNLRTRLIATPEDFRVFPLHRTIISV
jgi:hypothetical protein